ncbi:hypothetical protein J2Y56_003162 [Pseudomonas sp. BE134]|nr:hypothetical protein [Pseudomonas sp. BE134]
MAFGFGFELDDNFADATKKANQCLKHWASLVNTNGLPESPLTGWRLMSGELTRHMKIKLKNLFAFV